MAYLVGLLLLIEMVSCGTQGNPTAGSAKGTIVLEVVYEKAPKLAEAMYMDRMVTTVSQAGILILQQDLERLGDRWRGELEVNTGDYTVILEAYKLSKLKWKGSTSVNVRDSKTYPVQMRLVSQNTRPVSQAGEDQQVETGRVVHLDGSGSTDLDGDRLTYRWNAPAGIRLSNRTAAQPQFTATATGVYRFFLVVNDGYVDSAPDEVVITVNRRPVADAGRDQQVKVGAFVALDGTRSSDPDGSELSYRWTAPEGIELGGATSTKPHFTPAEPGEYRILLVVNDGYMDSVPDTVVVTVNRRPRANAGPDQQVRVGAFVALDGRRSSDPDGDELTYHWTASVGIELGGGTSGRPHFTPTEPGEYRFTLVVNDGYVDSVPDTVVITVNRRPVANAGADQQVQVDTFVTLDGRGSSDPDGDELSYRWTAREEIELGGRTSAQPHFSPDEPGEYHFTLGVNDGYVDSVPDTVVVTVREPSAQTVNQSPTANAGLDQAVELGTRVTLDGSGSSDPEGAPLTYRWTVPAGINLDVAAMRPQFVAESPGTYRFTLVVNDGTSDSDPNEVVIKVNAPTTGDAQIVGESQENTGDAQVIGTIEEDTGDAEITGEVQE